MKPKRVLAMSRSQWGEWRIAHHSHTRVGSAKEMWYVPQYWGREDVPIITPDRIEWFEETHLVDQKYLTSQISQAGFASCVYRAPLISDGDDPIQPGAGSFLNGSGWQPILDMHARGALNLDSVTPNKWSDYWQGCGARTGIICNGVIEWFETYTERRLRTMPTQHNFFQGE